MSTTPTQSPVIVANTPPTASQQQPVITTMQDLPSPHASPSESLSSHGGHRSREGDSPSSSSQGDSMDTDVDDSLPNTSSQQSGQPAKKKRTRTLTTPHQSAVLHALLARSRFPTTAMREEVGRQIGLSARKVQIWFQNQRQKARRPQGHNAPPPRLDRPPQFGPFPSVAMSAPPPENPHGTRPSQPSHLSHLFGPSLSHSEPSPSRHSVGGLVIPDPRYTLSPVTRLPSMYPSDYHSREPREESGLLPSLIRDPAHPLTSQSSSSSLDIPPSSQSSAHSTAMSPIPPPFTIEPTPRWQPEPMLPIGPAWRGPNLFGSPDRATFGPRREESLAPESINRFDAARFPASDARRPSEDDTDPAT